MHRCLQIDEIFHHIAQLIGGNLVSISLVCRAFYEPAMNVLWKDLGGLRPLIECLPRDTFRRDNVENIPMMVRNPSSEEWTRFQHHAPRVRKLTLLVPGFDDGGLSVGYSCFQALRSTHPAGPILPNLQEFILCDKSAMQYAPLFVQPSLQVAEGTYTAWGEGDTLEYLRALAERAVFLQHIDFSDRDDRGSPAMEKALSRVLCLSKHLATVKVGAPILPNALIHLGTLPSLTSLDFDLNDVDYRAILSSVSEPKFASLCSLELTTSAQRVEPLLGLLEALSPKTELTSLKIHLRLFHEEDDFGEERTRYRSPTASSLQRIISVVPRFKRLHTLVLSPWGYEFHLPDHIVPGDALRPLFQLGELSHLDMTAVPFALAPDDVVQMARAWPKLTFLFLGDRAKHNVVGVRPEDLLHFVRHCSDLETLGLQLLCEDDTISTDTRPAEGLPASRLQNLCLGEDTAIEDTSSLAAFLSDLFPLAELLHNHYNIEDEDEPEQWVLQIDEVNRLKSAFSAVRAQERKAASLKYGVVRPSQDSLETETETEIVGGARGL